jgi:endogenous inhibitor of DNA gyrase (YacG/DUF329 family)
MRCPDCNKFVPNGDPEAEVQSGEDFEAELDEGKLIIKCQPEVRVMIPCGECGTELKETILEFEMETEHECDKLPKKEPKGGIEVEGNIEVEATDDYRTKDKHGKAIKNPRYQAHLYGAEVTATVTCPFCQETIEFTDQDEVESSSMDELT